jgi:hypothetical protein
MEGLGLKEDAQDRIRWKWFDNIYLLYYLFSVCVYIFTTMSLVNKRSIYIYGNRPTLPKCGREDVSGYGLRSRDVKH